MKFPLLFIIYLETVRRPVSQLVLCLLLLNFTVFAEESHKINYRQCWKFESNKLTEMKPVAVSKNVVVALSDAALINLDAATGSVNWRAELGGEIVSSPVSDGKILIAVTKVNSGGNAQIVDSLVLRALSSETGLTIWQKNFPAARESFLIPNGKTFIFAANHSENSASLSSLEFATGEMRWNKILSSALTTNVYFSEREIYFGVKDSLIYSIGTERGEILKQFKIKTSGAKKIAASTSLIFFDDARGEVSALKQSDSRPIWTLRTGGAVQSILPTNRGLLATSLDNFVYLQRFSNGKRQWRRRLASRPLSATLVNDEIVLLLTNGENSATLLELKKGKISNQILLGDNNYAVAEPAIADNFVVIPTFNGVLGFAPENTACGKPLAAGNEESAK